MDRIEEYDIPILEGEEEWAMRVIDEEAANAVVAVVEVKTTE
jgi:hypothetical protein